MALLEYIQLFKKWLWLIVLLGILFGGVGYLLGNLQTPEYEASVKLLTNTSPRSPNPDLAQIEIGAELVKTYAELVRTYEVIESTIDEYDLPVTPEELRDNTQTFTISDTSILEIVVRHTDPELVPVMANGLAEQLIRNNPTDPSSAERDQIEFLQSEITILRRELANAREVIDEIDARLNGDELLRFDEIEELENERTVTFNRVIEISGTIAQLSNSLAGLQQESNEPEIVERARVPDEPVGISIYVITGLGGIIGFMLGTGIVLLLDELDQTMKTPSKVRRFAGQPVLTVIPAFGTRRDPSPHWLITRKDPLAKGSEAYRMLQTSLLFGNNEPRYVYICTSSVTGEGKTMTVANLGMSMANAGLKVLLVDANLRKPSLHRVFELDAESGLATMLARAGNHVGRQNGRVLVDSEVEEVADQLQSVICPTAFEDLFVLPRGELEDRGAVSRLTYRLNWFEDWLRILQSELGFDVVIFDTPPCLTSSESLILAGAVSPEILLMIEAGKTRREDTQEALERFAQIGRGVCGLVLNKAH